MVLDLLDVTDDVDDVTRRPALERFQHVQDDRSCHAPSRRTRSYTARVSSAVRDHVNVRACARPSRVCVAAMAGSSSDAIAAAHASASSADATIAASPAASGSAALSATIAGVPTAM